MILLNNYYFLYIKSSIMNFLVQSIVLISLTNCFYSYTFHRVYTRSILPIESTHHVQKVYNMHHRIQSSSISSENNIRSTTSQYNYSQIFSMINKQFWKILSTNWLVIGEVLVILLAQWNPSMGATGGILKPEFYISKLGVFFIFFVNGVALSLSGSPEEMSEATKTNLMIQGFNFGVIPIIVKLLAPYYPDAEFRDGLLVLACLPCTINICVAQTLAAGGNLGTAIFNAIFANVLGVFLTPVLAIWMLGIGKGVSLLSTLSKLGGVVIAPLILGQIVRRTPLVGFFQSISKYSRTMSSLLLLAIVYNVFSDTFKSGLGVGGSALLTLIGVMPLSYLAFSAFFWYLSIKFLPGLDAPTRSAALLCSSQKTLAFGIPFIKTALGSRPDLAYILAPLLMYAPAQLLLGSSLIVPALREKIQSQNVFQEGAGI